MNTHHRQFETWIYIIFFPKIKLPLFVIMSLQPVEVPVFVGELTFSH